MRSLLAVGLLFVVSEQVVAGCFEICPDAGGPPDSDVEYGPFEDHSAASAAKAAFINGLPPDDLPDENISGLGYCPNGGAGDAAARFRHKYKVDGCNCSTKHSWCYFDASSGGCPDGMGPDENGLCVEGGGEPDCSDTGDEVVTGGFDTGEHCVGGCLVDLEFCIELRNGSTACSGERTGAQCEADPVNDPQEYPVDDAGPTAANEASNADRYAADARDWSYHAFESAEDAQEAADATDAAPAEQDAQADYYAAEAQQAATDADAEATQSETHAANSNAAASDAAGAGSSSAAGGSMIEAWEEANEAEDWSRAAFGSAVDAQWGEDGAEGVAERALGWDDGDPSDDNDGDDLDDEDPNDDDDLGDFAPGGSDVGPELEDGRTIEEAINSFQGRVAGSQIGQAIDGLTFSSAGGGGCSIAAADAGMFGTIPLDSLCTFWDQVSPLIEVGALLMWSILAVRVFLEG